MLTRIVAKQAKTTKVKNKFVGGKKSSKEHSVVFLVEGEKFNLGKRNSAIKFRQKVQICLVGSVQTRSAHRLSSQLFAAVSTPNIAELVLFEISIKINYENNVKRPWPSGLVTGVSRRRAGFVTQWEQEIFSFFFLCFFSLIKRLG